MSDDNDLCHCGLPLEDHRLGGAAEHNFTPRCEMPGPVSDSYDGPDDDTVVIINGRHHKLSGTHASYNRIMSLAGYYGGIISISWHIIGQQNSGGILSPGGKVALVPGLTFTAMPTGNA